MSDKDRRSRDRDIEETVERAKRADRESVGIKPPEEESPHDVIQRRMRERFNEAARKRGADGPS
jgi:hypothetical protein